MNIKIDAEFSALIPPLSADESLQLKQNLLDEGCRDALIVWGDILIDGHNRLKICEEHNIPYSVIQNEFENRDDAVIYIISNQVGRRNISIANRSILALRLESCLDAQAKKNQQQSLGRGQKGLSLATNLFPKNTRKTIAKIAGVSENTIAKVKCISENGTPEQFQRIQHGGKGNTVGEVHREIRKPVPKPQEPLKPTHDPPQQAPVPQPIPIPAAPLSDPPFVPDMSIKERNRNIMKHVNALKDPNIERSFTPDMFYVEYKGFVEQFEQNLAAYYCNEYLDIYPEMSSSERERIVALNMKIIDLTQKRNEIIRSFTK